MASGPFHYRKAEELLSHTPDHTPTINSILEAIGHALLANAASGVRHVGNQGELEHQEQWFKALNGSKP